jgi:methionyl-tRNA synthetase
MPEKFYITTPIYYVNARPHIGHAYTTIAADVLARFQKLQGKDVFFLTGTDEHGLKIQKKADEAGLAPQQFVDGISDEFKKLWKDLNVDYSNFIRTTNLEHVEAVQKVLQTLYDKGAIYKGTYSGMYCVGCEQFKSENELVDGKCPDHGIVPEKMEEECYLLKMTDIQEKLIEKIESNEFEIAPERYKNEILSFLKSQKLNDISISRKNVAWGIPLPFDQSQTTYVWIDAFLNYLTGLGWSGDEKNIPDEWPVDVQFIGKDILRVHATIWPAILIHLGIELPKILFTHGHILSDGKKMSKTLGNSIAISDMLEIFGVDGTRYLLLSAGPFGQDIDVTMERMIENYNSGLANGLGNLVSRIIVLYQKTEEIFELQTYKNIAGFSPTQIEWFENLNFSQITDSINLDIYSLNKYIGDNEPWKLIKENKLEELHFVMDYLIDGLNAVSQKLSFFMPETAEKIKTALKTKKTGILFPRIK